MALKFLGLAVVLLIVWLYLRRRNTSSEAEHAPAASRQKVEDKTWHAVSIKFEKDACAAAKAMAGQRYLADEAPRLPLPECNAATCECRFTHHDDRRSGKDRRSPFGQGSIGGGTGRFDQERREAPGRRSSDDPF